MHDNIVEENEMFSASMRFHNVPPPLQGRVMIGSIANVTGIILDSSSKLTFIVPKILL